MGTTTGYDIAAEALFGKVRRAILALLFLHDDEFYKVRQIITLTECGQGAVQRELGELVDAGLVVCIRNRHGVYYQANRELPIFGDLRALLVKTVGVADVIRGALLPLSGRIIAAFVYQEAERRLGVLVIGSASAGEVADALGPAGEELAREISASVFSWSEFTRRKVEGDEFLVRALGGPKVFVIGDEREIGVG